MLDKKSVLILAMLDELRDAGSWAGETHLQKAMFFLSKKQTVATDFEFVLYKHGPYSFDLHDELSSLFGHMLVEQEHNPPYGPRLKLTESGERLLAASTDVLCDSNQKIQRVSTDFGNKGVTELEKLATALWAITNKADEPDEELAEYVHSIKPHISLDEALSAIRTVRE